MPQLKLFLLGAPRIELGGAPIDIDRRKAVALLAYLAVSAESHTRETLATLLWPELDRSRSYANLRRTIWEVNRALGPGWLEADRQMVAVKPGSELWLDVDAFEVLLSKCREAALSADCTEALGEAIALYRGDFMAGFTLPDSPNFDEWQFFQGDGLRRDLEQALERVASTHEQAGEYDLALPYARRWLGLDTLNEEAHRQLMRLYALMGQRSAALQQYDACVRFLEEELGVQPQAETTALFEQIASDQWPASRPPAHPAPSPTVSAPLLNLPSQLTPFVSRHELNEALSLLADPGCRLLTLVGPGGIGKTRLSIEAAAQLAQNDPKIFADGVWFVPLAPIDSADSIVAVMAGRLGFSFHKGGDSPQQQLVDYLRLRSMLIILDNFEHLLAEESVGLLNEILTSAPGVKLLVTSRIKLNAYGEQLLLLTGLSVPEANRVFTRGESMEEASVYGAIQLFYQSARRASPDFELTRENLSSVVHICRMVEGMPLGIELAAVWSSVLDPAEIAAEIEENLDFLRIELQGVPERQRSIRAVFEASWKMLTEQERSTFQRLTVFRGGFTRRAARPVSGDSLQTLSSLVNKSWLYRHSDGRFQIHELLRQYANERLRRNEPDWHGAKDRHADFFAALVRDLGPEMHGPRQKDAFDKVALELDNIRAAWLWHLDRGRMNLLVKEMLPGLFRFALARTMDDELLPLLERSRAEEEDGQEYPGGRNRLAIWLTAEAYLNTVRSIGHSPLYPLPLDTVQAAWEIVSAIDDQAEMGIWLIHLLELVAWGISQDEGMERLRGLLPAFRAQEDPWLLAQALEVLGELSLSRNALPEARTYLVDALESYAHFGDELNRASTLRKLAIVAFTEQAYQEAAELAQEAKELFLSIDDQAGVGICLHELAEISLKRGEFDQAFRFYQERRRVYVQMGHWRFVFESLHWESMQALRYSNVDHAMRTRQECLALCRELKFKLGIAWGEWELGEIYRVEHNIDRAVRHYRRSQELFEQIQLDRGLAFFHRGMGDVAQALEDYAEAQKQFHIFLEWSKGEPNHWGVSYALSGLGRAALGLEQVELARRRFLEALELANETGASELGMVALVGLADLFAKSGEAELAVQVAAFVANHYVSWRETKEQAGIVLAAATAELPEHEAKLAIERGKRGDQKSLITRLRAV